MSIIVTDAIELFSPLCCLCYLYILILVSFLVFL